MSYLKQIKRNIIIQTLHKCGSCFQELYFSTIATSMGYKLSKNIGDNIDHEVGVQDQWIKTLRYIYEVTDPDILTIIIIRHPLDRLISQYYSMGYTHDIQCEWIADESKRKNTCNKMIETRKVIQTMTLDEYVLDNILDRKMEYDIALRSKNVITYETMVHNFKKFCDIIGNLVGLDPEPLYIMYKSEFNESFDNSNDIINCNLITHRRTIQKNEYKNKLSEETLKIAEEKIGDILMAYDKLDTQSFISC